MRVAAMRQSEMLTSQERAPLFHPPHRSAVIVATR
jgi:hypothetical protein